MNLFFAHLRRAKRNHPPVLEVNESILNEIMGDESWRDQNYIWMEDVKIILKGKREEIERNENLQSHQILHGDASRIETGKA